MIHFFALSPFSAKAEKVMSVGKAMKDELSMMAKVAKMEPSMSVSKAAKDEEDDSSGSAGKTHKVDSQSMPFGGSAKAGKEMSMSIGKAGKEMSMGKSAKVFSL